jgi:hypothetical protein
VPGLSPTLQKPSLAGSSAISSRRLPHNLVREEVNREEEELAVLSCAELEEVGWGR